MTFLSVSARLTHRTPVTSTPLKIPSQTKPLRAHLALTYGPGLSEATDDLHRAKPTCIEDLESLPVRHLDRALACGPMNEIL